MRTALALVLAALLLSACGEKPAAPAPAPKPAAQAPKPEPHTTGKVAVTVPGHESDLVEVLCLPEITSSMKSMLRQQDADLKKRLAPPKAEEEAEEEDPSGLSAKDRETIEKYLAEARDGFPAPFVSQFTVNNDLREFESRESLRARYVPLIQAVGVDNLEESLNAIFTQMQADYDLLQGLAQGDDRNAYQARADINWLAALSDYMEEYKRVVRRYDSLRRREAYRVARETRRQTEPEKTPKEVWEEARQDTGPKMEMEFYKVSLGSCYPDETGHFDLKGHGVLVARIEVDGFSVFLPQKDGSEWVEFSEVGQTEKLPQ